jgi:uncharacterized protein (TIGR02996 family)
VRDEEAFRLSLLQHPDDVFLHLAFADWLEEHGRPESETIRLGCELARLWQSDPRGGRTRDLEERQRTLLDQHVRAVAAMCTPLRSSREKQIEVVLSSAPAEVRFTVYPGITAEGLAALLASPVFPAWTALEFLAEDVGGPWAVSAPALGWQELETLASSPSAQRLHSLAFDGQDFTDEMAAALANSPYLGGIKELSITEWPDERPWSARAIPPSLTGKGIDRLAGSFGPALLAPRPPEATAERMPSSGTVEELLAQLAAIAPAESPESPTTFRLWVPFRLRLDGRAARAAEALFLVDNAAAARFFYRTASSCRYGDEGGHWMEYERVQDELELWNRWHALNERYGWP